MGILLIVSGFYIYTRGKKSFQPKNLLYVRNIDVPSYTTVIINNQAYNIPKIIDNNWNSRCISCPLPCIYHTNPYLQLLGNELKDGFKMVPYPDSIFIENYRY